MLETKDKSGQVQVPRLPEQEVLGSSWSKSRGRLLLSGQSLVTRPFLSVLEFPHLMCVQFKAQQIKEFAWMAEREYKYNAAGTGLYPGLL